LNRLTQLSSDASGSVATTYSYDRNGNLTSTSQNNQVVTNYQYDGRDQLRRVLNGGNQELARYDYDCERRRIGKTVGGVSLNYVYGGDEVVNEYGDNNQLTNRHDVGAGEVLRAQLGGEGDRYYFSDGQGSITSLAQLTQSPPASLTTRYEYDAWGSYLAGTGFSNNAIGYTGQRYDGETGLMPLGNGERYYAPGLGSFIQQDSFTGMAMMAQSMNRYAYAQNNPLRFTDPSGHVGLAADWLKQKLSKSNRQLLHFVVGASYDAVDFLLMGVPGSTDVLAQAAVNRIQGKPSSLSQLGTALSHQGYGSVTPDSGTTQELIGNAGYGVVKTVAGAAKTLVWDMDPLVMGYRQVRQGARELPMAWNDPDAYNRMKREQLLGMWRGVKTWASDAYGGATHPSVLVEAIDDVGPNKAAEIVGSSYADTAMLLDGVTSAYKGVQAFRAARALESLEEVAEAGKFGELAPIAETPTLAEVGDAAPIAEPAALAQGLEEGVVPTKSGTLRSVEITYRGERIPGQGPAIPYNREVHYPNTPTNTDRALGLTDHEPPLVQRYYDGDPAMNELPGFLQSDAERAASAADRSRLRVPIEDYHAQGGRLKSYSMKMRRYFFGY